MKNKMLNKPFNWSGLNLEETCSNGNSLIKEEIKQELNNAKNVHKKAEEKVEELEKTLNELEKKLDNKEWKDNLE
ncbi:8955_t:CDS:2 [Funneliformis caledonium]|uniref:8955_t:CDS:1 n=1 Tax=Funneliformis caledonium TaxID=1117310 RepID=A0A9N9B716_9GLOM|nr:8955_t:CDS:2 [Funneliformis caledonium]